MHEHTAPTKTGILRRVWGRICIFSIIGVLIVLLCVLMNWGYHTSRFPESAENLILQSGISSVFGKKVYTIGEDSRQTIVPISPALTEVVEETVYRLRIEGYLRDFSLQDSQIRDIVLEIMDEKPLRLEGPFSVGRVWDQQCIDGSCLDTVLVPIQIDAVRRNLWAEIELTLTRAEGSHDDVWRITN